MVSSAGGQSIALYTKDEGKFNMEIGGDDFNSEKIEKFVKVGFIYGCRVQPGIVLT